MVWVADRAQQHVSQSAASSAVTETAVLTGPGIFSRLLGVFADWKINYGPSRHLLSQA
jgi:hypothetical protein